MRDGGRILGRRPKADQTAARRTMLSPESASFIPTVQCDTDDDEVRETTGDVTNTDETSNTSASQAPEGVERFNRQLRLLSNLSTLSRHKVRTRLRCDATRQRYARAILHLHVVRNCTKIFIHQEKPVATNKSPAFQHLPEPNRACLVGTCFVVT